MAPTVDHYLEVHFEDMVADTEALLRRVCDFIELDFDPVMLDYHERAEERLAEKARDLERPWGTVSAESRWRAMSSRPSMPRGDRIARWKTLMSEGGSRREVRGDRGRRPFAAVGL